MKKISKILILCRIASLLILMGYSVEIVTIKYAHWNALFKPYNTA